MIIRGILRKILKKLGDIFLIKNEHVYQPSSADLPVYIIDNRIYRIKPEDLYRTPNFRENMKALSEAALKNWGHGTKPAGEKTTAEAGETPAPAQKNSLRRPEGAD